ncbi:unnamed protein product [Closterium sp. NIES-53]
MKENKKLEKLWLLECPKLSGGALVSLVGHLAKACHEAGSDPVLKSMRLSGSTNVEGRHVRLLEKFRLADSLDVAPCPHCPKAGHVMIAPFAPSTSAEPTFSGLIAAFKEFVANVALSILAASVTPECCTITEIIGCNIIQQQVTVLSEQPIFTIYSK